MAITNANLSCVPAAAVTPGVIVAGIIDLPTTSKLFTVNQYTITAGTQTITASNPAVEGWGESALPTVATVTPVMAQDPVSGNFLPGSVKLVLAPAAGDTVNAASPMSFTVSPNALVIVSASAS